MANDLLVLGPHSFKSFSTYDGTKSPYPRTIRLYMNENPPISVVGSLYHLSLIGTGKVIALKDNVITVQFSEEDWSNYIVFQEQYAEHVKRILNIPAEQLAIFKSTIPDRRKYNGST